MKILIVGSGAREHAIAWKLAQNAQVEKVYFSTHNGGAKGKLENLNLPDNELSTIQEYIGNNPVDLVIIGPEDPLNAGIVDALKAQDIKVFGPEKAAAKLEKSKAFAKAFMQKYGIPTADYEQCHSLTDAQKALQHFTYPVVIKADGLCAGKGVYICKDEAEAQKALHEIFIDKVFADQGANVVLEQFLQGFEASLLCFVSGNKIYPFDTAMDYKKIYEGDLGPNTGGVGCISPNPYWTPELTAQSDQILRNIEQGLEAENLGYAGILFIGYMVKEGQIYVLEFNTRFGDPESQVLLPRLQSDLLENIQQALNHQEVQLSFGVDQCMTTILVSDGYPKTYQSGFEIQGLDQLPEDMLVFHNGTKQQDGKLITKGGRVLSITAKAPELEQARVAVYDAIKNLSFENMRYRKDIGAVH